MIGVSTKIFTKLNQNLMSGVSGYTKDSPLAITGLRTDNYVEFGACTASLEKGKTYTLQLKCDGTLAKGHSVQHYPDGEPFTVWLCQHIGDDKFDICYSKNTLAYQNDNKYVWVIKSFNYSAPNTYLRLNLYSNGTDAYTLHFWDIKLEEGSIATDIE